ncbi:MAG: site-specific integrase [Patescibacteria group bacterium]
MNNLSGFIDSYLSYLQYERNSSPKTIENYKLWLTRFAQFVGDIEPDKITSFLVLDYRKTLHSK